MGVCVFVCVHLCYFLWNLCVHLTWSTTAFVFYVFLCISLWNTPFILPISLKLSSSVNPCNYASSSCPPSFKLVFHTFAISVKFHTQIVLLRSWSRRHTVSVSACGCCGQCWSLEQRFEIVHYSATCYWSKSNWTLNINPHQASVQLHVKQQRNRSPLWKV